LGLGTSHETNASQEIDDDETNSDNDLKHEPTAKDQAIVAKELAIGWKAPETQPAVLRPLVEAEEQVDDDSLLVTCGEFVDDDTESKQKSKDGEDMKDEEDMEEYISIEDEADDNHA